MHTLTVKQTKHASLPSTYVHPSSTAAFSMPTSKRASVAERALKQSLDYPSDAPSIVKLKHLSDNSTPSPGLGGRLRAWRHSVTVVFSTPPKTPNKRQSRRSSRQPAAVGESSVLTQAKSTSSQDKPTFSPTPMSSASTSHMHPPRDVSSTSDSQSSSNSSSSSSTSNPNRIPFKIRDFTYQSPDPRHQGLGEDGRGTLNVPRQNRIRVIYKLLLDEAGYEAWKKAFSAAGKTDGQEAQNSDDTDEETEEEEMQDEEEEEDDQGWMGRWKLPSSSDPGESASAPDYYDDEEEEEGKEEEGPLTPGLYRALYAFEPEGSREMALKEDQVVRVVGRGGGAGWAVVVVDGVDEEGNRRKSQPDRQLALVPESYLEPMTLDEA